VGYFGGSCGNYYSSLTRESGDFVVKNFSDISHEIIPFFEKYPLVGSKKRKDFRQSLMGGLPEGRLFGFL
jgi:hypothetical protein